MPTTDHDHHLLDLDIPIFRPKPNIFNSRQLSEILYSLEKNEIPRKYGYFDKGVAKWANKSITSKEQFLVNRNTGKFSMFVAQYEMIVKTMDLVLGYIQNYNKVNIVDVGCGTGYPVFPILSFLQEKKQLGKYIAIDIVKEMCDLAVSNLKKESIIKNLKTYSYVHDFEDGHFADFIVKTRDEKNINLFCFFSNTLGTMIDRHRALANIRDSMGEGDLLWIGNTLYNNASKLADFYNNQVILNSEEYKYYHGDALSFFEVFEMEWWNFGEVKIVESEESEGLLKYKFIINSPFTLDLTNKHTSASARLTFKKGEEIVFVKLKNYKEADLIDELREAGFNVEMLNTSLDKRAALVLCSV